MLKCSQRLLEIFEYKKFHELMVDVRSLEKHINNFQESYRNSIYDEELQKYREIGRGKLDEFLDSYSKEFETLQHKNRQAVLALETELKVERASIEAKLNSDSHLLKFKPKKELRQYLTSEKLVALEERIEEAMNYRKELEKLSQKEADRLNHNLNTYITSKLKEHDIEAEKKIQHLKVKNANLENKLTIKMAKDFDVLVKKMTLHENDIKRIQNMSKKKAHLRGEQQGELIRLKNTLKKQNEIITNSKKKDLESGAVFSSTMTNQMGLSNSSSMRKMDDWERSPKSPTRLPSLLVDRPKPGVRQMELLKKNPEMIRFYIRQKFGQDIPVNSKLESYQQGDDQHHKIEKYLKGKLKDEEDGVHLAYLYTDDLREREDVRFVRQTDKSKLPQNETRQRITEMLSATGKYKL